MEKNKNIWIWTVIAVVALIFLFGSSGIGGYGMMGGGMGFGFIFMLLFWGALIWLVVTVINSAQGSKRENDALSILKNRYASGELTKKQYETMRKELLK